MFTRLALFVLLVSVLLYNVPKLFQPKLLPIVEGFFQPEFMQVARTLQRNMESGKEQGASFAVYYDGELVIDMWAGYADRESMRRWRNETTTLTFGCTKGVLSFVVALMVSRGLLNYSSPITDYWPEFGVKGKEKITLEMLLNHQAGLPYLEEAISLRDLDSDIQSVEKKLISLEPVWEPGTLHGYHDWTFGLILDKIVERQDPKHRTITQIFKEEIADILGIEFNMNLQRANVYKTARIFPPSPFNFIYQCLSNLPYLKMYIKSFTSSDSYIWKAWSSVKEAALPVSVLNDPELREIGCSSYSGTGTARGLAKLFSILANDGQFENNVVITQGILHQMTQPATNKTCYITGLPMEFSHGMQIFTNPYGEPILGYGGYGGQAVLADITNKLSIVYLTNYLSIYQNADDPKFLELQNSVYNNLQRYIDRIERMKGA